MSAATADDDDLIFVLGEFCKDMIRLHVCALATEEMKVTTLFSFRPRHPCIGIDDLGYAVCGSLFCVVGAGYHHKGKKYIDEFRMWDLNKWKGKKEFMRKKLPPRPRGAKSNPIVFSVNNRLYALAGLFNYSYFDDPTPTPSFEVYDPFGDEKQWMALPEPPLLPSHCISGYKVVDDTLYVAFSHRREDDQPSYYSFSLSVKDGQWCPIDIDNNTFLINLTNFGDWGRQKEDFDDDKKMFFHSIGTRMVACDLEAVTPRKGKDPLFHMSPDFNFVFYLDYPYLPIDGLPDLTDQGGQDHTTVGFLAHLAGNRYCAIYLVRDPANERQCIVACKFNLLKSNGKHFNPRIDNAGQLSADVVSLKFHPVDVRLDFYGQWHKMESKYHGAGKA